MGEEEPEPPLPPLVHGGERTAAEVLYPNMDGPGGPGHSPGRKEPGLPYDGPGFGFGNMLRRAAALIASNQRKAETPAPVPPPPTPPVVRLPPFPSLPKPGQQPLPK